MKGKCTWHFAPCCLESLQWIWPSSVNFPGSSWGFTLDKWFRDSDMKKTIVLKFIVSATAVSSAQRHVQNKGSRGQWCIVGIILPGSLPGWFACEPPSLCRRLLLHGLVWLLSRIPLAYSRLPCFPSPIKRSRLPSSALLCWGPEKSIHSWTPGWRLRL